ncbi:MAG TPA: hypothetical protein VF190_11025 [Rhodothermales bacterium]
MNIGNNILILVAAWLVVTGTGFYITFVTQPKNLERVEKAEQLASLKQAEVTSLLTEVASTKQMADDAVRKWHARYKVIPDSLTSFAVIDYLNGLTTSGFENFDVSLVGVQRAPDYSYYSFSIKGRGYYSSLYRFIWEVENNRLFYKVRNLAIEHIDLRDTEPMNGNERLRVMVSFNFTLDAYFAGREGLSAPEMMAGSLLEGDNLPAFQSDDVPPVPASYLAASQPRGNPFFPSVMDEIPPNTYNLLELEGANLVAIVGNKAVFQDANGTHRLGVGDKVYLGYIKLVDPKKDLVVVHLNKGGIVDEVELALHGGENYRQAMGPQSLAPITD